MVARKRGGKITASTPTTRNIVPRKRSRNLLDELDNPDQSLSSNTQNSHQLQLSEEESSDEELTNAGNGNQSDVSQSGSESDEEVESLQNIEPQPVRRGKIPYKNADLIMSCGKIQKIAKSWGIRKISRDAVVFLTGIVEYITSELLEISEEEALQAKKTRINHRHVMFAFKSDSAMDGARCWRGATFSMAGVVPKINPALIPARFKAKKAAVAAPARQEQHEEPPAEERAASEVSQEEEEEEEEAPQPAKEKSTKAQKGKKNTARDQGGKIAAAKPKSQSKPQPAPSKKVTRATKRKSDENQPGPSGVRSKIVKKTLKPPPHLLDTSDDSD